MNSNNKVSNSIELTKKLIKKRKVLKRKLDQLIRNQEHTEQIFSPITKHLETIVDKIDKKSVKCTPTKDESEHHKTVRIKKINKNDQPETFSNKLNSKLRIAAKVANLKNKINDLKVEEKDENIYHNLNSTPKSSDYLEHKFHKNETFEYEPEQANVDNYTLNELIDEAVEESKDNISKILDTSVYNKYLEDFHELPRYYIDGLLHDKTREFDNRTGIRHDSFQEKYFIGSSEVTFEGANVIINNNKYIGTPGLYELLFKNQPNNYSKEDLKNYKNILDISNAHRRNFKPNEQILGTRSTKYNGIIAPLYFDSAFQTPKNKRLGKEFFKDLNNNSINYIYWDDPNKLVKRLKLLVLSETAGNQSHNNEKISSINR